jgi:RNA polymerase sigma-70 factor, ECF subfamily
MPLAPCPRPPLDSLRRVSYDPDSRKIASVPHTYGAVAQLGERGVRNAEVGSSILLRSTLFCVACRAGLGLGPLRLFSGREFLGCFSMVSETAAGDPSTELMLRVRDGDAGAFEQLMGLWQNRLVTLFLHQTGDHSTAEDLAQEVFLRVYRSRATYQPTAKFTTWIHTIANNVASDLRQRSYRRREYGLASNVSASSSAIGLDQIAVAASGQMPARLADRTELQAVVQQALGTLNDRQRMAVLLAKFEQCSYEEIAAAMDLSVPAVKSLLFRARDQLREAIAPYMQLDQP